MTWNLERFRNLCVAKNLPDSRVYQNTLVWKKELALFHAEQSQVVWDNLFSPHRKLVVGGKEWSDTQFASEAHIIAAAQALHSMADILGQIINQSVLCGALSEKKVSLKCIIDKLEKGGIAPDVRTKIYQLINSTEFKYINAFVNTNKHRRILDIDYHWEYGVSKRNDQGIRFKAFTYNNERFPTMWAKDIVGAYKSHIINLICDVGNVINAYLGES